MLKTVCRLLLLLLCCINLVAWGASDNTQPARIRIAMIHFAPEPGGVDANRLRIEQGTRLAAEKGANWVLTPELAVSGYGFADVIGTDWIQPQPDVWMNSYATLLLDAWPDSLHRDTRKGPGFGQTS